MGWTKGGVQGQGVGGQGQGALGKQKQKIKELSRVHHYYIPSAFGRTCKYDGLLNSFSFIVITIQAHEAFAQQHAGNITSWLSPGVLRQWQNLRRFGRYGNT
uniref:Uncharacterized protein n=1 Tax=Pyricularia oryzae (strain 70-15 / ATCC MYA-4617 / FGSC 8958) TaxID=242507 RepID=Q2KGE9_PYRO7|nr:hypothetical protein MGCH7_ch7g386 [Pyricularia oryzae 70-15]